MTTAEIRKTCITAPSTTAIEEAGTLLRAGELVAFPTETVYGLGGNALDPRAVAAIFAAKERPRINPLICHVLDIGQAERLVTVEGLARELARAFWPGPLTLVLPKRSDCPLSDLVSAGLPAAAIRVPANRIAREVLKAAGVPVAAPSANRSGRISPTSAGHVRDELDGRIAMILDGGACEFGLESTIIGFEGEIPVLLRKGAIERGAIEMMTGPLRDYGGGKLEAPGMMRSHYAPATPLRLGAQSVRAGEALLAFGPATPKTDEPSLNLSPTGDLSEAAANLFSMLRALDARSPSSIAVMPIPDTGLGEAINDRLMRAAAPREE